MISGPAPPDSVESVRISSACLSCCLEDPCPCEYTQSLPTLASVASSPREEPGEEGGFGVEITQTTYPLYVF